MIHSLIEELVDDHEIVAKTFFFELTEIILENLGKAKEKGQYKRDIGVALCDGAEVQVGELKERKKGKSL